MIKIDDLTVRFGGVKPLDSVDVEFPVGTCGLIGPNGAGKTTFFNVLSGFVNPTSGSVMAFDDRPVRDAALPARALGAAADVPDRAGDRGALASSTTSRWCTSTRGENRGQRRDDVMGALGFVGLDHLDPRSKVGVLGARDRRLVEIARAVVGRPRLVLLDEPAAGLPDEETEHLGRGHPEHPRAAWARS